MPTLLRWLAPWLIKAGAAIGAIVGLGLYILHVEQKASSEQRAADRQAIERAQSAQTIADLRRTAAVGRERTSITENSNDVLSSALADARARAAAYLERMRDEDAQRGGDRADLPRLPGGAARADGSGEAADFSEADRDICIENTVRLQNARDWYREQEEVKE